MDTDARQSEQTESVAADAPVATMVQGLNSTVKGVNKYQHLAPTQFQKGTSGNPNGRPSGWSLREKVSCGLAVAEDSYPEVFKAFYTEDRVGEFLSAVHEHALRGSGVALGILSERLMPPRIKPVHRSVSVHVEGTPGGLLRRLAELGPVDSWQNREAGVQDVVAEPATDDPHSPSLPLNDGGDGGQGIK